MLCMILGLYDRNEGGDGIQGREWYYIVYVPRVPRLAPVSLGLDSTYSRG